MKKEIIRSKTEKQCINVSANQVESLRNNNDIETTVRLYDGGNIGVAGKIGNCDVAGLEQKAKENLAQGIPYPETADKPAVLSVNNVKDIIAPERFVPAAKHLIARLAEENPEFLFSNKIITEKFRRSYETDGGTHYDYVGNKIDIGLAVKYKGSANIMDEFVGGSADYYDEDEIAADAKTICTNFLHKIPQVEEEEIPVIFDGGGIAMFLLQHFVADLYCNGASLLNSKLHQKVFHPALSVAIERNEDALNIPFFDIEGVVNENFKNYLIKEGVMTNLLTTKKTAAQYGVDNIGSASAEYTAVPNIGAGGLTIEATHEDLEAILHGKKAVFVSVESGGDTTPSGDFSLPCMVAYLYQGGKLHGRLPEFAVSGNLLEAFGDGFLGCTKKGIHRFGQHLYTVVHAKLVNKAQ